MERRHDKRVFLVTAVTPPDADAPRENTASPNLTRAFRPEESRRRALMQRDYIGA